MEREVVNRSTVQRIQNTAWAAKEGQNIHVSLRGFNTLLKEFQRTGTQIMTEKHYLKRKHVSFPDVETNISPET